MRPFLLLPSRPGSLFLALTFGVTGAIAPTPSEAQEVGVGQAEPAVPFIYFREREISTLETQATSVFAVDLDGDDDVDVLSTSDDNWTVVWYENDGGSPPAFTKRTITEDARNARSVYATDIDGDGDIDVVSSALLGDNIAWHENDGGSPPEFTTHLVTDVIWGTWSIYATDIDGDLDVDLVSASVVHSRIAWWENDGGVLPQFTQHDISLAADWAQGVYAADLDGDGDTDVLSASRGDNTIAWYENDGGSPPLFTQHFLKKAEGAKSVYATDLDADGDVDVLAAARFTDTIAWYENDGASPPIFEERIITTNADGATSVYATDVDGDGDTDVLSASEQDNRIAWYESDGASPPAFIERTISSRARRATGVYAADIDNDGDVDALSSRWGDDTVSWYEQLSFGAAIEGMTLASRQCQNIESGRIGDATDDGNSTWNCQDLGVTASSGDRVALSASGAADGTGALGGSVTGLTAGAARSVTCSNLTTAQTVRFDIAERSWDCEAQGLVVRPGHEVRQVVTGEL